MISSFVNYFATCTCTNMQRSKSESLNFKNWQNLSQFKLSTTLTKDLYFCLIYLGSFKEIQLAANHCSIKIP